jgi:beta-lactamase regulating signal transducer with metallopeptidase domain
MLAVLNHLWQSTLFAATAGLLTLALLRHGAHVRYGMWFAASIKFLIPFSALAALGGHIRWAGRTGAVVVPDILDRMVDPFATAAAIPTGLMKLTSAGVLPASPWRNFTGHLDWVWISIWAAGAFAVLIRWLLRWLPIQTAVRHSRPLPVAAASPVRVSQYQVEPGVVGFFRPILLLPAGMAEQLRPEQLQAIVAHEMCHIRRHDNLAALCHMLVEALFWFYPPVWWLGRRLMTEREFACDEAVIAAGNDREAYASGILQVCRHYLDSQLICAAGVGGADLRLRIERIMTPRLVSTLSMARKAMLAAVAAATVITPVAFGSAFAANIPASPVPQRAGEARELRRLLAQGEYPELDRRMNGFQQAYESHALDEAGLLRAFAAFDVADPALEANFNAWVLAFPHSYAARLARGGYYYVCGTQTRGGRAIAHTTQAQLNGMSLYFGQSQRDLKDSLALDSKPLLSYNLLIRMDMETGTQQSTRALLNAALKIDSGAMSVRRAYMRSLQTRWGGSLNEMLSFMQETRKAGFSEDQLWTLDKLIDEERRWISRYQGAR